MKRPAVLIVGAVAGALLVAGIGASAHTGLFVTRSAGLQSGVLGDESSTASVAEQSPEPSETPEPTPSPEASATPEPAETDADTETNDDTETGAPTNDQETGSNQSGNQEGSDHESSGGGGQGD